MTDKIAGTTSIDSALGKFTQSIDGGDALKAALGSRYKIIENSIARERSNLAMQRELTGGSQTARLALEAGGMGTIGAGLGYYNGQDLSSATAGALLGAGVRYGGKKLMANQKEKLGAELARLLLSNGPRVINGIKTTAEKSGAQQERINGIIKTLLVGGGTSITAN